MNNYSCVGNLTKSPQMSNKSEKSFAYGFAVAIRDGKDSDGEPNTLFLDCKAWGTSADILDKYTKKGSKVGLTGRLTTDKWKDKNDENRSKIVLVIQNVSLVSSKKDDEESNERSNSRNTRNSSSNSNSAESKKDKKSSNTAW